MSWISFSIVFERPAISIELIETVKRKKYDAERERFLNKMWKKSHSLYLDIFLYFCSFSIKLSCKNQVKRLRWFWSGMNKTVMRVWCLKFVWVKQLYFSDIFPITQTRKCISLNARWFFFILYDCLGNGDIKFIDGENSIHKDECRHMFIYSIHFESTNKYHE